VHLFVQQVKKSIFQFLLTFMALKDYARERKIKMVGNATETLTIVRQTASVAAHQRTNVSFVLARSAFSISLLVIVALLSACSTSAPTATSAPQQAAASSTPNPTATSSPIVKPAPTLASSPTAIPAETGTPQQATASTALDPCQLLPSQEASSLAGTSFGAGTEGTNPGGGMTCTYGSQTTNIFFVEVVQAPDTATADAAQTQFVNDLQANLKQLTNEGLNVTPLPNFADAALIAQASVNAGGETINGSAIAFRKGTTFFGFSDVVLGGPAPSSADLQTEATTVLGRLP
jgi:hypothetical protein